MSTICYRTASSVKKRLDTMMKNYKTSEIIIDHGVANYEFDHYEYTEGNYKNNYVDIIEIFVKDFDKDNTIVSYMTLSEKNLRKQKADDWFADLVWCSWNSDYPTILYMKDYCTN